MKAVNNDRFDNKDIEIIYSRVPQKVDSDKHAPVHKSGRAAITGVKTPQEENSKFLDPAGQDCDVRKKSLQEELIDHYMNNGYCQSALPALMDDDEVDGANLFLMPALRIFKPSNAKAPGCLKSEDKITTICGLFGKKGQYNRRVCISGDAGLGKTMLCQKILSNWCKLHSNQGTENLQDCDQEFLKSFDFMFYIPLRNHATSDVIEMIKTEIVRTHMHDFLDEVLHRDSKTCFIILDGLDEWLPPEGYNKKIPFFDRREKATVIITSRPWKLDVLRPKTCDIGHKIELCGFTEDLREDCIRGVVEILNEKRGERKKSSEILLSKQYKKVEDLLQFPIMLTQIVCMWYDDFDVGETRFKVYCQMFDYLLQLANKRHHEAIEQNGEKLSWLEPKMTDNKCLLDIFKGLSFCEKYSDLLYKLSDLAFHALFCEKKEISLVFQYSDVRIYRLNEMDITFCLKVGLLSQAKFYRKVTLPSKKLSFTHKTFQELLAALFVASGDENSFINMMQKVTSFEDVLEMSQVMICIAGLRPDLVRRMCQHISALGHTDKRFAKSDTDERVQNFGNEDFATKISRLFIDCIKTRYYEDFAQKIPRLIVDLIQEGYYDGKEAPTADLDSIISSWMTENADGAIDNAL